MTDTSRQFRPDIQGLRAIAVLAVTLFHFKVPGLQGGYVGVDIFFVISGFLMTSILLRRMASGSYGYWSFIWSRAARIYPPMVVLLVALLALGYFFLDPAGYAFLGKGSLSAVASAANVYFYLQSFDYFAPTQQSNWLLHLWSLGVECHFYLLYPLALVLAYRLGRVRLALWLLFTASLGLSVAFTPAHQSATFFLLPARVWEFAAGGLAFCYQDRLPTAARRVMLACGLVAIACAIVFFRESMRFPGWIAMLPALGTAFVIAARSETLVLTNRVARFFGDISYSMYLWHWPLWVAAAQYRVPMTAPVIAGLTGVSVVLGWLSYRLIETPTNRSRHRGRLPAAILAGLSCAAAAFSASAVVMNAGYPNRVPELVRDVIPRFKDDITHHVRHNICFADLNQGQHGFMDRCFAPQPGKESMFFWGDSYAAHLWFGFEADPRFASLNLMGGTTAGCFPTITALDDFNRSCSSNNAYVLQRILNAKPDVVVLFARWRFAIEKNFDIAAAVAKTVDLLRKEGIHVIVIGPQPEWTPTLPQRLTQEGFARGGMIPERLHDPSQPEIQALDEKMRLAVDGKAAYVSLYKLFCNAEGCQTTITRGNRVDLVAYDFGHMTVPTAMLVAERAAAALPDLGPDIQ